jgi:hypothetical protein
MRDCDRRDNRKHGVAGAVDVTAEKTPSQATRRRGSACACAHAGAAAGTCTCATAAEG